MRINKWLKMMTLALGLSLAALPAYANVFGSNDETEEGALSAQENWSIGVINQWINKSSMSLFNDLKIFGSKIADGALSAQENWSIGVINQWINNSSMSLSNDLEVAGSSNTVNREETTVTNTTDTTDKGGSTSSGDSSDESSSSGSTSRGGASGGAVTEAKADGTVTTATETKKDGAVVETKAEVDVPVTTGSTVKNSESDGKDTKTVIIKTVENSESDGNALEIKIAKNSKSDKPVPWALSPETSAPDSKETPILVQKVAPGVLLLTPVNLGNSNNGREGTAKKVFNTKKKQGEEGVLSVISPYSGQKTEEKEKITVK